MTLLFKVIYATHANGTHHKLALDALNRLDAPQALRWQRLFLKHAELYMKGSKAPDKEFKDFRNHVLHPGDEYWGGAPEKARGWYTHLVTALKDHNWSEAVWCAGVLSHYYTDPIHPFHTAQSDAESAIHRAVEWSISKSYNELYALGRQHQDAIEVTIPDGDNWIEQLVCQGADTSHEHYERLIAHYDINVGVSDPPAGLDTVSRKLIGDLLVYATTGFARILDRAFQEAGVTPPEVNLSVNTVLAGLKIPLKWVLRKMDDATERDAVRAMYDELTLTGRVEENLPNDDRIIRALHAKEILEPARAKRDKARARRVNARKTDTKQQQQLSTLKPVAAIPVAPNPDTQAPAPHQLVQIPRPAKKPDTKSNDTQPMAKTSPASPSTPQPIARDTEREHRTTTSTSTKREPRIYLEAGDQLQDAPAIGPKTATRLATVGLLTVNDLMKADPEQIAESVTMRHITAATVRDWQDFARLVMTVPGLRGTHAQLLAGAGFRTRDEIADAEPTELSAAILRFATTSNGNRILRDGTPPDIEKIKTWVENAALARAA